MKKFLNPNPPIKSTLIYIFLAIFIVISIFFLVSNYQNDKKKYEMEDDFAFFERYFKGFQKTAEKINNPGNPAEIRAAMYFVLDSKYSFAKNAMYSDKFIYIVAEEMIKYDIGNGKQLYLFRNKFEGVNAKVISKKSQRYEERGNGWIYLLDGKLFFGEYHGPRRYITTNYTEIESKRKATEQEMAKLDDIEYDKVNKLDWRYSHIINEIDEEERKMEKEKEKNPNSTDTPTATPNVYYYRPNSYKKVFTREEMEKMDKEEGCPSRSYYYYYPNGNALTQKELDKLDTKENERERRESDESEFEDREEREYWESEEYWGEEGIEKEVY